MTERHSDIGDLLPEPWFMVAGRTSAVHTDELRKELAASHPLFEHRHNLVVIAKSGANDDVLVADLSNPDQFYCVHLTWALHPEAEGFPGSRALNRGDLAAFFREEGTI